MHLIPSPKQLLFQTGGCDVERGLAFDDRLALLAGKADNFNLPNDPSGIPVHLAFAALPIPATVNHAELIELQAYRLEISAHEMTITVSDLQGAYAALATLRQIVRQYPTRNLPCLTIFDYPTIPSRGIMVDVSRGKIPNRKTFTRLVQLSFAYKLNVLQLYWEDCYRLSRHNQVGTLNGWYDQKEVAWMEKLCQAYGVELQANIQTFSHMQGLLRLPGFSHLAENDSLFTLAPGNGDVYTLLDEILGEVLPWFSSKTVHLNMDGRMIWEQGSAWDRPRTSVRNRSMWTISTGLPPWPASMEPKRY
ncbi:MAG: glycoside hydrolase family 20 zincin-like fold domain-containing protein, partial [Sphaerochaetaceae bacterium]